MAELIRDTAFGHLLRFVSRSKWLKFAEEADPTYALCYITRRPTTEQADQFSEKSQCQTPTGSSTTESAKDSLESGDGDIADAVKWSAEYLDARLSDSSTQDLAPRHPDFFGDQERKGDLRIVTWYGDDDPENPRNWSLFKKAFVTFQICLLTTSVYIGSSIYAAGTESIMSIFGVSKVAAILGLTLFVLGYGVGPMLWSPMSEVPQIGRNPIYLGTLAVFIAFQAPTALASNYGMLMAFRFLTGVFGSPVLATGGASLTDIWKPSTRAYPMAIWGLSAVCGPVLGPVVGNFAVEYGPLVSSFTTAPWTWPIWELMFLSGFCLLFLLFFMPETSANNILVRRTRRLRKITGDQSLKCEPEIMAENMTGKDVLMMCIVRAFTLNFTEPMVFLLNLYIALVYGLLYVWFESFVIVFIEEYHFGLGIQGLTYLGIFVGVVATIVPLFAYIKYVIEPQFDENGDLQPEKRLPPAFVGAFCIPICLFWFGWTATASIHWIVPIIGSSFFGIGGFLLFQSIMNYLPDAYPDYAASVLAGNDLMRSCFGAGFPLSAGAMYTNLGTAWASSTLGFISIAFIPIPFVLYAYGPTLRKNFSKIARKDI